MGWRIIRKKCWWLRKLKKTWFNQLWELHEIDREAPFLLAWSWSLITWQRLGLLGFAARAWGWEREIAGICSIGAYVVLPKSTSRGFTAFIHGASTVWTHDLLVSLRETWSDHCHGEAGVAVPTRGECQICQWGEGETLCFWRSEFTFGLLLCKSHPRPKTLG